MNKEETKEKILDIMEFLDNGESFMFGELYKGHPGFYYFHTKDEMLKELEKELKKESYDRYDVYYIVQKLIAYLLSKYDSHTRLYFLNNRQIPLTFKVIDGKVYIEKMTDKLENLVCGEVVSINGVDIKTLIKEIEKITCYSTIGYLEYSIKTSLKSFNILKSLPSIDNNAETIDFEINYNGETKYLTFDKNCNDYNYNDVKENYVYKIIDNTLVLTYSSCQDFDKMKEYVEEIRKVSEENNINNFIVDIRDNRGGNSAIIKPLLEFLNGKNIVTLVNETTFSAARMAFVDLKELGSHSIGTCISTSLNCFGENARHKNYEELGLAATGSSRYFYYDRNLAKTSLTGKEEFESFFKGKKELLEPFILYPDEEVYLTLDDIKNGRDAQLESALDYLKNNKKL